MKAAVYGGIVDSESIIFSILDEIDANFGGKIDEIVPVLIDTLPSNGGTELIKKWCETQSRKCEDTEIVSLDNVLQTRYNRNLLTCDYLILFGINWSVRQWAEQLGMKVIEATALPNALAVFRQ
jgi:hypothetical protein